MENLNKPRKSKDAARTAARREDIRTLLNIIFCVVGLVISFLYLAREQSIGWAFLGGFTFLLMTQLQGEEDFYDF
ncbi:hypothetical protein [Tellurirhabdus rosea]|uniref:hypothetical protein n=1 Tax=Tellurirhabdus rosea TaxID=2674997 RepID=UPI00224F5053|nr:hypothetical protein [Tellurirhabdus rosea]